MKRPHRRVLVDTAPVDAYDKRLADAQQQVAFLKRELAEVRSELSATARERARLADEVASARLIIAGIAHECEANCMHAKAAKELMHTLYAQERVIAELQAVNEGYESRRWQPRAEPAAVPGQRQH